MRGDDVGQCHRILTMHPLHLFIVLAVQALLLQQALPGVAVSNWLLLPHEPGVPKARVFESIAAKNPSRGSRS